MQWDVEYTDIFGSWWQELVRELRVQHKGMPIRVLYAFDPRRVALLLLGGSKKGNERWYQAFVPVAEKLYDQHLEHIRTEGQTNG